MSAPAVLATDTPKRARARPPPPPASSSSSTQRRPYSDGAPPSSQNTAAVLPPPLQESGLLRARPGLRRAEQKATRDENMTVIIEDIPLGPVDFPHPPGDPSFNTLEPYSGIRLRNRALPFDQFQSIMEYTRYISPSTLYAMVQQYHDPNHQSGYNFRTDGKYTLPIEGDWVVIGVLAEKSQIRITKGGKGRQDSDDEKDPAAEGLDFDGQGNAQNRSKKRNNGADPNPSLRPYSEPRKYMAWKLVDFGSSSSAPGGDSRTRGTDSGDCVLSLQLFAADEALEAPKDDESRNHVRAEVRNGFRNTPATIHRGGSRGAFEKYYKEREGTVVAIVSPRIMRRATVNGVNYDKNLLSITPVDAASVHVIGRASDYAQCQAHRKDGVRCNAWVDSRTGTGVCDYHLEQGVNAARRGRQEFASGTSGGAWKAHGQNAGNGDADDIFTLRGQKGKRGGWKGKQGQNGDSQNNQWNDSFGEGMDAGFASSSNPSSRKKPFVVEGAGTWVERSGKIQADGRGPKVGDINFDVSEAYGRQKEERKERMRAQAAVSQLEDALKEKAPAITPRPPPEAAGLDDDDEAEDAADWILQGSSTAAQALREAKRVLTYKQEMAAAAAEGAAKGGRKNKSRLFRTNDDALLAAALIKNTRERHRADDGTAPAKRPRWAYSAEAIQRMGFDPLAGAPGRAGAVPVWKENETPDQGSKNKLLARVSGPTTDLPAPRLRKKRK
ncbi:unnamed protein product [Tilletia laevis]|uniref:Zinc finger Mcm10/DnaG-type domain-containing protein n=3 Tax=Tilletia TaxID=13289 RepID=A0A8X7MWX6_9BASI|nr:hypothetical protein CF335_g7051 [Tilletia laevis]KAE8202985.1 hypothetical protein CF328_g1899 [Tilletia controversa]KAE8247084.1 hypothetical protein A4X03_0g7145 [Tilletia caries]KAE8200507.1 hypothetical protein CF336_g648 [Tilletia laevis]KAE8252362.1 hypothetical protein A4X06_0g2247 [Tilletia controversa]